jgi:hypothetical protein
VRGDVLLAGLSVLALPADADSFRSASWTATYVKNLDIILVLMLAALLLLLLLLLLHELLPQQVASFSLLLRDCLTAPAAASAAGIVAQLNTGMLLRLPASLLHAHCALLLAFAATHHES